MSTGLFVEQATAKYMDIRKKIGRNPYVSDQVVENSVKKAIQSAMDSKSHVFILPFTKETDLFWANVQGKSMHVLKMAYDLVEDNKDQMLKMLSGIGSSEERDLAIYIAIARNEPGKDANHYLEEAKELIKNWNEEIQGDMSMYFGLIRKMGDAFSITQLNKEIEKKCETVLNDKMMLVIEEEKKDKLKKNMERFPDVAFEKNLADLMNMSEHCDTMLKSFAEEVHMEPPVSFSMDYMKEDFFDRAD